ncbi:MAG: ATP-binding cassette domain-containing protein [Deltaproteobacteria bacterium]|nr:ATP-binding cassette domain-containing protein [Deltaproteobacteria bacterium]
MEKDPIIEVKQLRAGYNGNTILEQVSFGVLKGEVFVIMGGSGCGKTTLFKHLVGLIKPVSGSIIIDGDDIAHGDETLLRKVLRKIGVLYQSAALFNSMTIAENIALPIREYTDLSEKSIDTLVKMKLTLVNLDGYENYLPSEISGGMKKRAGLARAMALNPEILFFDEPSAGLDPVASNELDNLIIQLNKNLGTTMVIVTHELRSVCHIAHRAILLDKNKKGILVDGDPRYLRDHSTDPMVKAFFNGRS